MTKNLWKVMIIAIMVTFIVPISASAAIPTYADATKNRIELPTAIKAGRTFNAKFVGHRREVLSGSVKEETKYSIHICQIYDAQGKLIEHKNLYETSSQLQLPLRPTAITIQKPGRYEIKAEFVKCRWNNYTWGSYTTDRAYINKTIQVQGQVKFNVGSQGKLKKGFSKSKWKNHNAKIGTLPKITIKKGYKFMGWYTKKRGGKKITKSTKVKFSDKAKVYYARYKSI